MENYVLVNNYNNMICQLLIKDKNCIEVYKEYPFNCK